MSGRCWADRSWDKKPRCRALGSPESTGFSCPRVALRLPRYNITGGFKGVSWMWCWKRRNNALPTFFQNCQRKVSPIKETLSVSNVTTQIRPPCIACHSWDRLKGDIDKVWYDGIVKWHCDTCPPWYDECHPWLGEAALLGEFSPANEKMTKLLNEDPLSSPPGLPNTFWFGPSLTQKPEHAAHRKKKSNGSFYFVKITSMSITWSSS